jgi:hypothetical protein
MRKRVTVLRVLIEGQPEDRQKVSAMALTHRLDELSLLTEWGYRTACVNLSRLGYRSGEPVGIPHESSQLLAKVLRVLRDVEILIDDMTDSSSDTELTFR